MWLAHLAERLPEGEAAPTIVDGARPYGTGVNFVGAPPLLGAVALDHDTPVLGASLVKGLPSVAWLGRRRRRPHGCVWGSGWLRGGPWGRRAYELCHNVSCSGSSGRPLCRAHARLRPPSQRVGTQPRVVKECVDARVPGRKLRRIWRKWEVQQGPQHGQCVVAVVDAGQP